MKIGVAKTIQGKTNIADFTLILKLLTCNTVHGFIEN